jgi:hypothetical protein
MFIRTKDGQWYVRGIELGAVVTFVSARDRGHCMAFQRDVAEKMAQALSEMSGLELEAVESF